MFIHNKTHLEVQQISVDKNGQIIDSFTIIKDKPKPRWLTSNKTVV